MKKIVYATSMAILLAACTDERFAGNPPTTGGETGKAVPVGLVLKTQPLQPPAAAATKAGTGKAPRRAQAFKGMEVSLAEAPATRADVDNEIRNFWVFQFNGIEPGSRLVRKGFYTGNSTASVELSESASKNRIIVIGNTGGATFSSLTADPSSGTTLAGFEDMGIAASTAGFPLFNDGADNLPVLAGSTDMAVSANKQADVMLYRTVARVNLHLTVSKAMVDKMYASWQGQIMHVPAKSYYFPNTREAVFPEASVGYANYPATTVPQGSLAAGPDGSVSFSSSAWLPVNLQQHVPYTTPEQRRANAPANATYIQIMGVGTGAASQSVIYQIHLGANFTDDYSVSPNYQYNYEITITGESEDDSRVVKFIPGFFGGTLRAYKADGATPASSDAEKAVWRYDKRIEVSILDVTYADTGSYMGAWSGGDTPSPNSFSDGRSNTWALNAGNYPAAKSCIALNTGTPSGAESLVWFLPSYDQAIGIYVAGSSTAKAFPDEYYWTSTFASSPWCMMVTNGESIPATASSAYRLRCIREIGAYSAVSEP